MKNAKRVMGQIGGGEAAFVRVLWGRALGECLSTNLKDKRGSSAEQCRSKYTKALRREGLE